MKREQAGFTLIELVMVIVILGILAATALPKFVNMSGDARKAVMEGVEGAMRSANTMIYAKAAAEQKHAEASETLNMFGATIAIEYGFAADAEELAKAMDLSPAADFTITAANIQHAKAGAPAECQIGYTKAANANTAPTYTRTLTNCN